MDPSIPQIHETTRVSLTQPRPRRDGRKPFLLKDSKEDLPEGAEGTADGESGTDRSQGRSYSVGRPSEDESGSNVDVTA